MIVSIKYQNLGNKMTFTDPIADMLTRIRNANSSNHKFVVMPYSKLKEKISIILKEEGYIVSFKVRKKHNFKYNLVLYLKYIFDKKRTIVGIKRISKPGLRVYVNSRNIPRVLNGFGIAIISTSVGLLTNKMAFKKKIGGEILAYVW